MVSVLSGLPAVKISISAKIYLRYWQKAYYSYTNIIALSPKYSILIKCINNKGGWVCEDSLYFCSHAAC